jgi:hypothetical protein
VKAIDPVEVRGLSKETEVEVLIVSHNRVVYGGRNSKVFIL